jgi:hypothetical protein
MYPKFMRNESAYLFSTPILRKLRQVSSNSRLVIPLLFQSQNLTLLRKIDRSRSPPKRVYSPRATSRLPRQQSSARPLAAPPPPEQLRPPEPSLSSLSKRSKLSHVKFDISA